MLHVFGAEVHTLLTIPFRELLLTGRDMAK